MAIEPSELVAWVKAFAFTQAVEAPIYRKFAPTSWRIALAASAITHPFVWFVFPRLGDQLDWGWTRTSIVSEVFAVVVEGLLLWRAAKVSPTRAALLSVCANGASVALGLLVRHTVGIV